MSDVSTQQISGWLDQMAQGDHGSLQDLLRHLDGRVRSVASSARARLHNQGGGLCETDDLIQNLSIRLINRCESLSDRLAEVPPAERVRFFFGCTARIIRDLVCEEARRPRVRRALSESTNDDESDARCLLGGIADRDNESPSELATWGEFHRFVNELPEGLREVADLYWYHGLTHAEVGETLGIAEVTSRSRWAQVRHKAIQRFADSPFQAPQ